MKTYTCHAVQAEMVFTTLSSSTTHHTSGTKPEDIQMRL
jgi:hypothetical protein